MTMNTLVDQIKFQAKLGRRFLRRLQKQIKGGSSKLNDSPRIFCNSFPKSGTHWLTQVLEGLPLVGSAVNSGLPAVVVFERESGRERASAEILRDLNRYQPGDSGYGHLHARPELVDKLTQPGWCTYFILRDPRDIVVSHMFYVMDIEPDHVHHDYYAHVLKKPAERLKTSILGRPDAENPFPNIADRFQPYLAWISQPEVLSLRYEDAIANPETTIGQIVTHAVQKGLHLDYPQDEAVSILAGTMDPHRSPTFRQGKSGGWRKHFTPEITTLFKQTAGQLLIDLGYEKDLDWE
jgi:hypothetical protein